MKRTIFLLLGAVVVPILAISTSTAPVGYGLAYLMEKHSAKLTTSKEAQRPEPIC